MQIAWHHAGNITCSAGIHFLPFHLLPKDSPSPSNCWRGGRICHLNLEAVPEVGHECVVLLPALIDIFDQLLGPLLQDLNV